MSTLKERLLTKDYGKIIRNIITAMVFLAIISGLFFAFVAIPELKMAMPYGIDAALYYRPSTLVEVTSEILAICALILFTLYWISFSIYLYKKAEEADIIPLLWLFLALYMNIFALFAFLIVRSVIRQRCPECRHYVKKNDIYCKHCGKEVKRKCNECGEYVDFGARYCPKCGNNLDAE